MVTYKEGPHPQQFILTEANGQRSRENIEVPVGQKFPPGTVIGPSGIPALSGGNLAIAMYGVDTTAEGAEPVKISVIARDAEVNRHAMAWPDGTDDAAIDAAAVELAKQGIIVRGVPYDQMGGLPSPAPAEAEASAASGEQQASS